MFLKRIFLVAVMATLILSACGGAAPAAPEDGIQITFRAPAENIVATLTALPTATATLTPVASKTPRIVTPTAPAAPTANAPAQNGATQSFNNVASFSVSGAPNRVDSANVLRAMGSDAYGNYFTNTVGLGTEMMFAEPGSILYGPDEPASVVNANPNGEYISPINQQMLGTETFTTNTAEGAFTWATGASMTVSVGKYTIRVENTGATCNNNWFVVIRGLFADGQQDSDRNTTTKFSNYVAGHTQVMWYPQGAYISEGNFLQVAEASHTDHRNCGAEGTSGLSVLMLDLNTGAYAVVYQANLGQPWQAIASNWR